MDESAFEFLAKFDPDFCDDPCISFLDLTTGKVVSPDEEEVGMLIRDANFLVLNAEIFEGLHYGSLDEFVHSLPDDPLRGRLRNAIRGKGAIRRFKDIVFGEGNVELKHRWQWFETRRRRTRIVEWFRDENIEPDWGRRVSLQLCEGKRCLVAKRPWMVAGRFNARTLGQRKIASHRDA